MRNENIWISLIKAVLAALIVFAALSYASRAEAQDDIIQCPGGQLTSIPDRLHQKLFNASINVGVGRGARLLQQSVNALRNPDIAVDGKIGPATRGALCGLSEDAVIEQYKRQQAAFYRSIVARRPSQGKFLKGWLNRAAWEPE
jgi:lysozyme family protein